MPSYGKLVRDRVPEIIRRNGETPIVRFLSRSEFGRSLAVKLVEECEELAETDDRLGMLLEMADIKEVLMALCREHRVPFDITLRHNRPYDPEARTRLLDAAKYVRDSSDHAQTLRAFCRQFAEVLDCYCFCREEVERKQEKRRSERGGFDQRLFLIRVIEPGSLL